MTADDDAFLRTIVDNPGNDVPRLVYADWLDDRDDPRGPFLRAEAEWAQPWKDGKRASVATGPWGMATKLDPLWVARVARPPMGVCCDHLRFAGSGPVLRRKDVDEIDRWPGVRLPPEYKAFLLNHNGGTAHSRAPLVRREQIRTRLELVTFWPVIPPGDPKDDRTLHGHVQRYWDHYLPELLESWPSDTDEQRWVSDMIPIGISFDDGFDCPSAIGHLSDLELPDTLDDRVPELTNWVMLGTRRRMHPNTYHYSCQFVVPLPKLLAHVWGSELIVEKSQTQTPPSDAVEGELPF